MKKQPLRICHFSLGKRAKNTGVNAFEIGAPFFGHRSKLLCATSRGNFISPAFPLEKVGRSYPRDAARSATQRGRPCLPLRRAFAGLRHYAPSHLLPRSPALINTPFARPAGYKQALPGHTARRRRPYNAENYFPRP